MKSHHLSGAQGNPLQAPLLFENSHITTQQLFGEETCFLYSQLNILTQIGGLLCPSGATRTCAEFNEGENYLEMGNGLFGFVSASQGFSSQQSCAQTLSSHLSLSPLTDFLLTSLRGLLEIFRGHFSPGFSPGEAGTPEIEVTCVGMSVGLLLLPEEETRAGICPALTQGALPASEMHWALVRTPG